MLSASAVARLPPLDEGEVRELAARPGVPRVRHPIIHRAIAAAIDDDG